MTNRNSTEFTTKKSVPHHRISVKDVIRDYQAGLLTPAGAIFYLVAASRKIGESVKFSRSQICKSLGIKRTTFYRAIASLEDDCRLKISAPDEVTLTIPISTTDGVPDYIFLSELSQKWDADSQKWDADSQKWDADSQKWDAQPPEPLQDNEPGSPQLDQLDQSFKQLTTGDEVSPTSPPVGEKVEEELKASGIELTESQFQQIETFPEERILQAIGIVRGSREVRDKVRLFFKALRNGWRSKLPPESTQNFKDWFDRVRAQGLVVASMRGEDGVIRVLMPDERWLPLADAILEVSEL